MTTAAAPAPAPAAVGGAGMAATGGGDRQFRLYSSPAGGPRARRATDVLLLVGALIGLALLIALYPPGDLEKPLESFLANLPGWLDPVFGFFYDLLPLWAVAVFVAAAVSRRHRVAVEGLAALVLAIAIAIVSARLAIGHWPDIGNAIRGGSSSPEIPALRIAEAAAVLLTIGAHLVHGLQRAGHWILGLGLVGGLVVGPASPGGNLAAVLVGLAAAAAVRLSFGTSVGEPWLSDIAAALQEHGFAVSGLRAADRQVAGVFEARAQDEEGRPLLVKIYASDASDNQLLSTFWRKLWYQDSGATPGANRAWAVEHEAFVTLLAERVGVPTRDVVTGVETDRGDAVLVLRGDVRPLAELPSDQVDDKALDHWWSALSKLRDSGVAHRRIDPSTVALVGDAAGLVDFGHATAAPTPGELMSDSAQLLASTAVAAGNDLAVKAAVGSLGKDGVVSLLPYLQPAAFSGPLRKAVKGAGIEVDKLRKQTAAAVDTKDPELVKLHRLTWSSVLQVALLVLAVLAITKAVAKVDFAALKDDLANASWWWIAFAFVLSQTPRLTQAVALMGSLAAKLRYGPLYVLELATSYLNVALPSSVAKTAINIRFFQRQGVSGAAAATAQALNSTVSNIVKWLLVILLVLFSGEDVDFKLSKSKSSGNLLWIVIGIVVVAAIVIVLVPRFRRSVASHLKTWWPEVTGSLKALRASHKLPLLIGGKAATEILFAMALGVFAVSLGFHIPLSDLIVINTGTAILSGFIPVPGGIGVTEFGLMLGLTSVGMPRSPAVATVFLYRLSTFYLPPIWGYFALRWLKRGRYL
jgi:glycosyltransferase 2 family protein